MLIQQLSKLVIQPTESCGKSNHDLTIQPTSDLIENSTANSTNNSTNDLTGDSNGDLFYDLFGDSVPNPKYNSTSGKLTANLVGIYVVT